jgi:LPXTG-motif cell wall-anchored protein
MLGFSSLLALIGLVTVMFSAILFFTRKRRSLVLASFILGLLLIFIPGTLTYLLAN